MDNPTLRLIAMLELLEHNLADLELSTNQGKMLDSAIENADLLDQLGQTLNQAMQNDDSPQGSRIAA